MTKKKQTKRALLSSVMSIILCFIMLLGTTFAWFTDTASTGINTINSGNLDMELSFKPYGAENTEWTPINAETVVFGKDALYEPGYTEAIWLKVENKGSLAFRYNLALNVANEKPGTNMSEKEFNLSDHLVVKYMNTTDYAGFESGYYTTRESLDSFNWGGAANSGTTSLKDKIVAINNGVAYAKNDTAMAGFDTSYVLVVIQMPTTVTNEANHKGKGFEPSIDFSLSAVATQLAHEDDSFNNQYDADSVYEGALKAEGNIHTLTDDLTLTDKPLYSNHTATEAYTINGNGYTVTGDVSSVDAFQWSADGTIPAMSNIFSSENGDKVTVNDITFTGTMSAVMAGNYVDANSNWFNTEFNNVNIIDSEVVSFSAGISPALVVYGNMAMNDCTVYGTTLSTLDTDPAWPVYDVALVNSSVTTMNGGKIGSIYTWAKAKLELNDVDVDLIVPNGNMNTNSAYGIYINEGTTVDTIDLTKITNSAKLNITIAEGATVNQIVDDGNTYASIEAWQAAQ